MTLYIQDFPDEVRWKLRLRAMETGVTFRDLIIDVLRGYSDGLGETVGVKRKADVRGMWKGIQSEGVKALQASVPTACSELQFAEEEPLRAGRV